MRAFMKAVRWLDPVFPGLSARLLVCPVTGASADKEEEAAFLAASAAQAPEDWLSALAARAPLPLLPPPPRRPRPPAPMALGRLLARLPEEASRLRARASDLRARFEPLLPKPPPVRFRPFSPLPPPGGVLCPIERFVLLSSGDVVAESRPARLIQALLRRVEAESGRLPDRVLLAPPAAIDKILRAASTDRPPLSKASADVRGCLEGAASRGIRRLSVSGGPDAFLLEASDGGAEIFSLSPPEAADWISGLDAWFAAADPEFPALALSPLDPTLPPSLLSAKMSSFPPRRNDASRSANASVPRRDVELRRKGSPPTCQEEAFAGLSPTDAAQSVWIADALDFDPRGAAVFGSLSAHAPLAAALAFLAPPLIAVSAADPEASAVLAALASRSSPKSRVVAAAPPSAALAAPSLRRRITPSAPLPKPAP